MEVMSEAKRGVYFARLYILVVGADWDYGDLIGCDVVLSLNVIAHAAAEHDDFARIPEPVHLFGTQQLRGGVTRRDHVQYDSAIRLEIVDGVNKRHSSQASVDTRRESHHGRRRTDQDEVVFRPHEKPEQGGVLNIRFARSLSGVGRPFGRGIAIRVIRIPFQVSFRARPRSAPVSERGASLPEVASDLTFKGGVLYKFRLDRTSIPTSP
jgi:hypothetical protein